MGPTPRYRRDEGGVITRGLILHISHQGAVRKAVDAHVDHQGTGFDPLPGMKLGLPTATTSKSARRTWVSRSWVKR